MANMTEAQWKPYLAGLAGAGVTGWSGWVEDVDQSLGGEYTLLVDMDSPEELFSVFDVRFAVDAETALGLVKDSEVQFLGVIESANNILGSVVVTLRDAELE